MAAQRGTCRKLKNNLSNSNMFSISYFLGSCPTLKDRIALLSCQCEAPPVTGARATALRTPARRLRLCATRAHACAQTSFVRRCRRCGGYAVLRLRGRSPHAHVCTTRPKSASRERGTGARRESILVCKQSNKQLVSYVCAVELLCDPVCNLECVRRQAHEWPGRARVLWCRSR